MNATTQAVEQPWRTRIVGHADVAPADLVPNPRKWRTHPAEQQAALSGALSEVGWVAEVLVNRTTGHVVDGHLRVDLAVARKEPTIPVTYVELSEDEERLVLATLDPPGPGGFPVDLGITSAARHYNFGGIGGVVGEFQATVVKIG